MFRCRCAASVWGCLKSFDDGGVRPRCGYFVSVVDDAHKQTVKEENVSLVLHKIIKRWKASSYYINTSQITCEDEYFSRRRELKTSLQDVLAALKCTQYKYDDTLNRETKHWARCDVSNKGCLCKAAIRGDDRLRSHKQKCLF